MTSGPIQFSSVQSLSCVRLFATHTPGLPVHHQLPEFTQTTSWQIEGENIEAGTDFLSLGSRIITDGDCSHEIRRRLLLGRKAMTNPDSVLKSRDITDKGLYSQGYGLPQGSRRVFRAGLWRRWSIEELMLSNCDAGEDS